MNINGLNINYYEKCTETIQLLYVFDTPYQSFFISEGFDGIVEDL